MCYILYNRSEKRGMNPMTGRTTNSSMTSPKNVKVIERRNLVMRLRKDGLNYVQIAEKVNALIPFEDLPKNYDERYAFKDVDRELQKAAKETFEDASQILMLDLQRYDDLLYGLQKRLRFFMEAPAEDESGEIIYDSYGEPLSAFFTQAVGNQRMDAIIDRILKVLEQRRKMVGMDQTIHHHIVSWQKEMIDAGIPNPENIFEDMVNKRMDAIMLEGGELKEAVVEPEKLEEIEAEFVELDQELEKND